MTREWSKLLCLYLEHRHAVVFAGVATSVLVLMLARERILVSLFLRVFFLAYGGARACRSFSG